MAHQRAVPPLPPPEGDPADSGSRGLLRDSLRDHGIPEEASHKGTFQGVLPGISGHAASRRHGEYKGVRLVGSPAQEFEVPLAQEGGLVRGLERCRAAPCGQHTARSGPTPGERGNSSTPVYLIFVDRRVCTMKRSIRDRTRKWLQETLCGFLGGHEWRALPGKTPFCWYCWKGKSDQKKVPPGNPS